MWACGHGHGRLGVCLGGPPIMYSSSIDLVYLKSWMLMLVISDLIVGPWVYGHVPGQVGMGVWVGVCLGGPPIMYSSYSH